MIVADNLEDKCRRDIKDRLDVIDENHPPVKRALLEDKFTADNSQSVSRSHFETK